MPSLIPILSAPRRTTKQSLIAAAFFAGELALAAVLLWVAYRFIHTGGLPWAIVSAILVLYPGVAQSFTAALLRIAANLLGSLVGFGVGHFLGTDIGGMIVALVLTVFIGELLRMDLALRTACVASVIVMTANEHNVDLSIVERLISVLCGCGVALVIQAAVQPIGKLLPFVARSEVRPAPASAAAE